MTEKAVSMNNGVERVESCVFLGDKLDASWYMVSECVDIEDTYGLEEIQ